MIVDLSKAYDFIPNDSLIAKLKAYDLDKTSLHLLMDYLKYWKQRIKRSSSFSDWWDVICGIPQELILQGWIHWGGHPAGSPLFHDQ